MWRNSTWWVPMLPKFTETQIIIASERWNLRAFSYRRNSLYSAQYIPPIHPGPWNHRVKRDEFWHALIMWTYCLLCNDLRIVSYWEIKNHWHLIHQDTVLAVLDATLEPISGEQNSFVVYYSILDGDEDGRSPVDPYFNSSTKSCLQKIAKSNNKVGVVCV